MSQSTVIFLAVVVAGAIFIVARGELSAYARVIL